MKYLTLLVSLLLAASAWAQIYKTTDEDGNVVFTDSPPANVDSTRIEMRETNTAPPPDAAPPQQEAEAQEDAPPPFEIAITEPANETTIPNGPGNFSVRAVLKPKLGARQTLQLYLNGNPWGDPQTRTDWELVNVFRGSQDLTISVLDKAGKALATSAPVRVYVHRPSVNFRNRN